MSKQDFEDAVLLYFKEIAQAIYVNEYISKAHDDYNKEKGKISTYDDIVDWISQRGLRGDTDV